MNILSGLSQGLSNVGSGLAQAAQGVAAASPQWASYDLELRRQKAAQEQEEKRRQERQAEIDRQQKERDRANRQGAALAALNLAIKSGSPTAINSALQEAVSEETLGMSVLNPAVQGDIIKGLADTSTVAPMPGVPGVFYKIKPDGGIEYVESSYYEDPTAATQPLMDPVANYDSKGGFFVRKSGKVEWLPPEFRKSAEATGTTGRKIHSVDTSRGIIYWDDGLVTTPDLPKAFGTNKSINTLPIYSGIMEQVTQGKISTKAASALALGNLREAGMNPTEAARKALQWGDEFAQFKYQVNWSAGQENELASVEEMASTADALLGMLNDPSVRADLGRLPGWWGRAERYVTGGAGANPETLKFLTTVINYKDVLIRSRTGATVRGDEIAMYDEMLGSDVQDPDALRTKLTASINNTSRRRRSLWRAGLTAKGEPFTEGDLDNIPQYVPQYMDVDGTGIVPVSKGELLYEED